VSRQCRSDSSTVKSPEPTTKSESRRGFLSKAWIAVGLVAVLEAIWIVVDFLRPRKAAATDDAGIVVAGPIDRFEPCSVTAFPEGKFYLVRLDDGGFLALSRECTHLGCTVPWVVEESRFVCPCHSSTFDIHGDVLSQPAPRPLDHYAIRIENQIVKVDTSEALRRNSYEPRQVTRT